MERIAPGETDEDLFDYVLIQLNGLPNYTTRSKLAKFVDSITSHPDIAMPQPTSWHLMRPTTEMTTHAFLKYDWNLGRSEEEADARFTEILEACDRLKKAKLTLPTFAPSPIIEPVLVCPTVPIDLPDQGWPLSPLGDRPLEFKGFSSFIRLPRSSDHHKRMKSSSRHAGPSVDSRFESPLNYANDNKLNDINFVRKKFEEAKAERERYEAANRLLRVRSLRGKDRLNL